MLAIVDPIWATVHYIHWCSFLKILVHWLFPLLLRGDLWNHPFTSTHGVQGNITISWSPTTKSHHITIAQRARAPRYCLKEPITRTHGVCIPYINTISHRHIKLSFTTLLSIHILCKIWGWPQLWNTKVIKLGNEDFHLFFINFKPYVLFMKFSTNHEYEFLRNLARMWNNSMHHYTLFVISA